jgi:hypothetical protein
MIRHWETDLSPKDIAVLPWDEIERSLEYLRGF